MKVIKRPDKYCFIGNSVTFDIETKSPDIISFTVSSALYCEELAGYPYKMGDNYHISLQIQDILSSFFEKKYTINDTDQLISVVSDLTMVYTLKVNNEDIFEGIALKGGISKAAIKLLARNNYNIFTYKIMNTFGQFLFTTRTFARTIPIKDTELSDFIFLHPGTSITFTNEKDYEIQAGTMALFTPCSLNLEAIYNRFTILTDAVPTQINVYVDTVKAFSFDIKPGTQSEYQNTIRFRNSFGVFEKIEITGKPYQKPEFAEDKKYQALTEHGFFEEHRARVEHVDVMEVETGYKTRAEHSFIMDMIKSDEIYFVDKDGIENRCLVSASNVKFEERLTTPSSVSLKIRMVDSEEFVASGLDLNELLEGRIFTDNYDEQFN